VYYGAHQKTLNVGRWHLVSKYLHSGNRRCN